MARLRWTPKAVADLEAIRDYIGRSSPRYGALVARRLAGACDVLREHPAIGRAVPELDRADVRELVRGSYRIVYLLAGSPEPREAMAVVLTIFRASRRFPDPEDVGLPPAP